MSKRPLSVGDRVRVWDGSNRLLGHKGVVENVCGHNGLVHVKMDDPNEFCDTPLIHEKQCRRLKRKPKAAKPKEERPREERWIVHTNGGLGGTLNWAERVFRSQGEAASHAANPLCAPRKFVELRDSERIVSREDLARAFGLAYAQANPSQILDTRLFNKLVTALGFPEETK